MTERKTALQKQRARAKKFSLIRRVVVYATMTLCVLAFSTVVLLLMLGYRFNKDNGTIQQGGLVQFISQPSSATVTVGNATLANKTRSKITLYPGEYEVKMDLKGYDTWKKTVQIKPDTVLWLNSARLLPTNLQTTEVKQYPTLGSSLMRPGGSFIAVVPKADEPTIELVKITSDTPSYQTLQIPEGSYHSGSTHIFTLEKWSGNDSTLLLKHVYDDKTEWLAVRRDAPDKPRVVPSLENATATKVIFDPRTDGKLLALYSDGTLQSIPTSPTDENVKTLLSNVATFSTVSDQIVYTTVAQDATVSTGYFSLGSEKGRLLASYNATEPVRIAGGRYFNDFYFATSVGSALTVRQTNTLPSSESDEPIEFSTVTKQSLIEPPVHLTFRAGGRLVVAQQSKAMQIYDMELSKLLHTPIVDALQPVINEIDWLDEFHYLHDSGDKARLYEYDGTNQRVIAAVAPGFGVGFSPTDKFFYSVKKTPEGYALQRTLLLVP